MWTCCLQVLDSCVEVLTKHVNGWRTQLSRGTTPRPLPLSSIATCRFATLVAIGPFLTVWLCAAGGTPLSPEDVDTVDEDLEQIKGYFEFGGEGLEEGEIEKTMRRLTRTVRLLPTSLLAMATLCWLWLGCPCCCLPQGRRNG
eukprot:COSAG04_NODE_3067_length_3206_cov_2.209849_2_plen_143_part_00